MGRHRPLWLCPACSGLCVQWNSAVPVMGSSVTWIDNGCYGFPCLLWASRPSKLCSACYGQESILSWVIHLPLFLLPEFGPWWIELPCPYHAVSWVGPDLLFVHRVVSFCCNYAISKPSPTHANLIATSCLASDSSSLSTVVVNLALHPELRQLAQALPYNLVHNSVASTVSTYLGAFKSWKAWALQHNASVLPADKELFMTFARPYSFVHCMLGTLNLCMSTFLLELI